MEIIDEKWGNLYSWYYVMGWSNILFMELLSCLGSNFWFGLESIGDGWLKLKWAGIWTGLTDLFQSHDNRYFFSVWKMGVNLWCGSDMLLQASLFMLQGKKWRKQLNYLRNKGRWLYFIIISVLGFWNVILPVEWDHTSQSLN